MVHIQLDELVTKVRRWAKRAWVWTAQDAQSQSVVGLVCGRTHPGGCPPDGASGDTGAGQGCVPVFTSDGLRQYFYALTAHFGAVG